MRSRQLCAKCLKIYSMCSTTGNATHHLACRCFWTLPTERSTFYYHPQKRNALLYLSLARTSFTSKKKTFQTAKWILMDWRRLQELFSTSKNRPQNSLLVRGEFDSRLKDTGLDWCPQPTDKVSLSKMPDPLIAPQGDEFTDLQWIQIHLKTH